MYKEDARIEQKGCPATTRGLAKGKLIFVSLGKDTKGFAKLSTKTAQDTLCRLSMSDVSTEFSRIYVSWTATYSQMLRV